jgi:hypothetical protein
VGEDGQDDMAAVQAVVADQFIRFLAQQGGGQVIIEDQRLVIDDEMGGAGSRGGQRRLAGWFVYCHAAEVISG